MGKLGLGPNKLAAQTPVNLSCLGPNVISSISIESGEGLVSCLEPFFFNRYSRRGWGESKGESDGLRDADAGGRRSWVVIGGTGSGRAWWMVLICVFGASDEPCFIDTGGASHRGAGGFTSSGWRVASRSVGVDQVSSGDGFQA